jgi:N-acyl homoserine lactone hydrolase
MPARIIPLDVGQITEVEMSGQLYLTEPGTKICAQMIMWLVLGDDFVGVVDSGPGTPDIVDERFGRVLVQAPEQTPVAALRAVGLELNDIDVVVQSHLHWDHCLGLESNPFPNADIYIQQSEIQYASAPYPPHRRVYDPHLLNLLMPSYASTVTGLKVINGDFSLAKGIDILHSPGHTPGMSTLMVETAAGIHAIASDNVPLDQGHRGPGQDEWIPPGVHVNLDQFYASMSRISALADYVLPAHDPVVFAELERFALA